MHKSNILLVEDDPAVHGLVKEFLENAGYEVQVADNCAGAQKVIDAQIPDLALLDFCLPDGNIFPLLPQLTAKNRGMPIIIVSGYATVGMAVEAVKLGAEHVLTKPLDLNKLLSLVRQKLESASDTQTLYREVLLDPFVGHSPTIKRLAEMAHKVVDGECPILIEGESGTGKGILAQWLHRNGPRKDYPFLDLNCSGLASDLVETELFGRQERIGTETAHSREGIFEIADCGTVFLDEVGDIDWQVQSKLIKYIELRQFRRVGDAHERKTDVRLIASTQRKLRCLVKENRFREDLYFRMSTFPLRTVALRQRTQDIPALSEQLLTGIAANLRLGKPELTPKALELLKTHHWPGNIRELRSVLERAVLTTGGAVLTQEAIQFEANNEEKLAWAGDISKTLQDVQREYIERVLEQCGGRVESAARTLGMPRSSLYNKLKRYRMSHLASRSVM